MPAHFENVIVPMLSPIDSDERIDVAAVGRTVEFLVRAGVAGIFVLGSNGEGPALRASERKSLVIETVSAVAGRCPVLAGILEPSTARVIDEARSLSDAGLAGFVATSPFYYSGYSDPELVTHFRAIADALSVPLLVYNIPQNTKVPVRSSVVRALMDADNIAGLKDSSGDWTEFQAILLDAARPAGFKMLQGAQSLSAVSLIAGADGLVPGHANVCPDLLLTLCAAARKGDVAAALSRQQQLDRMLAVRGRAFLHANKLVASRLGLMQDHVTRPLPRMNAAEAMALLNATAEAGVAFPQAA